MIPTLTANYEAYNALKKSSYAIVFKGKDVRPDQLYQKKNGYFMSNLKDENGRFGKQADIKHIDNTSAKGAMVASSVFAVASMATSMYYMKNINDKLSDLQGAVKDILSFLENDKQSQIETDMEILRDIANNMQAIKANNDLKQVRLQQFSALQREAKKNIRFYEKQLRESLNSYTNNIIDTMTNNPLKKLKKEYYYYRICLQEYAVSKLIEIQLTNSFSERQLQNAREEINKMSDKHKSLSNQIISEMYDRHFDSIEAKAMKGLSDSLGFMGSIVKATPLGMTELDETLISLGKQSGKLIKNKAKKDVDQVLTRADYGIIDPVVDSIKQMEATYHKPLELIKDGDEAYISILVD